MPYTLRCQVFKNIGIKTGITDSYIEWEYKSNSFTPVENIKSDRSIGLLILLSGDVIDKKYYASNVSIGLLQKNGVVNGFTVTQSGFLNPYVEDYKINYFTLNPSFRGKLPIGETFNFYGMVGVRADVMISHTNNLESNFVYRIQKDEELKKINYGINLGLGFEKSLNKLLLRAEYSVLTNFNSIIDAKGPRLDGFGDEGFYSKLNSITSIYSLSLALRL
jgi:hypothetical protein